MNSVKARWIRYIHIFVRKLKVWYGKSEQRDISELAHRELFDRAFYLEVYPDIAAAGVDPLSHFLEIGLSEGRLPLSIQDPGSICRIQHALKLDPTNYLAIQLKLAIELSHPDLSVVRDSLAQFSRTLSAEHIELHKSRLEDAAVDILLKRYRHENDNTFSEIFLTLKLFSALLPESDRITCAIGLTAFRLNKFKAAGEHLAKIPVIPPGLADLVNEAKASITEANRVNHSAPANAKLLLLDSSFPSKVSSFRYGEFKEYLEEIHESAIHVLPDNLSMYGEPLPFHAQIEQILSSTKIDSSRIRHFDADFIGEPKVAYCVFLNLADHFYTKIGIPSADHLIFTLYPGGGFNLNDKVSDQKLRQLCNNPKVSKIITTQNVSYRYLVDGFFCEPNRIQHIYGGIIPHIYELGERHSHCKKIDKPLDICFVAQRYSSNGAEKGYDVFVDVMKIFANSPEIRFHVVGGYDESTIEFGNIKNITFYGAQPASFFDQFYTDMDLILSPNINASALDPTQPDSFDGFPTTTVVEAGLRNVAIFLTDFKGMNKRLDGSLIFKEHEMRIIDRDADHISELIKSYLQNREALLELGKAGRNAILREFSYEAQMRPRIELLNSFILS